MFALLRRPTARGSSGGRAATRAARTAEAFDLAAVARDHAVDALAAALLDAGRAPSRISFDLRPKARGAARRTACAIGRVPEPLLEEVAAAGAEQVIS